MKPLIRLLVTISVNVSVLAACSGWIGSDHRITDAWGKIGQNETAVRIDKHGWRVEHYSAMFLIR